VGSTLKDVAAHAGVSMKTVSNVVNDYHYVSAEMRARVRVSIEALGYRPNLPARHLRKAHSSVIALAIPDLTNTYFSDIGETVSAAAAAQSYTMLLEHTRGARASEALVARGLRPHLIDGVILSPLALEMADLEPDRAPLPLVLIGEHLMEAPKDHVAIDNVAAARLATNHLVQMGRRRIAVIGLQELSGAEAMRLRLRGYREALADAGFPADPTLIAPVHVLHRSDGAEAMQRLLALDEPPDAVFCFNDLVAFGAIRALHEAGYRVPDDVAIVGFDDIDEARFSIPTLTTISPDKEEIGRRAVAMLLGRIQGTRTGPPEHITPSFTLIIRESTAGSIAGHAAPRLGRAPPDGAWVAKGGIPQTAL